MEELLNYFLKSNEIIIIECEYSGKFLIGKVKKINKNNILFHHFDALGKWNDSYEKINFSSITVIELRSRYIKAYTRYFENEMK